MWNDRMHDTLARLNNGPLLKRLVALAIMLALLIGFRHLALLFVAFLILTRAFEFLGGRIAALTGQTERRGVIVVLVLLSGLLAVGVWAVVHAGGRFYGQLLALRDGRSLTEI